MSLMLDRRSDSTTSRFSSPGTPKIRSTPSFSKAATSRSEPFIRRLHYGIEGRNCQRAQSSYLDLAPQLPCFSHSEMPSFAGTVEQPPLWLHSVIGKGALTMVDSQSQALNLQHGDDQALHSLLQEWIAKQAQGRKTKDQTDRKAFPDLDDGTSRTQPSYFSPSVPEPSVDSPSGTSPESSIDPNQRANIQEVGGRSSVGRRTFRTVVSGLIIAVAVGAGWQVYRGDQTKELLKTWGHSSLIWMSAVLGASQRGSELATEPDSKLSDHAVTPSTTSVTVKESPELQQQLQNVVSDLAALQRLVEQVASKQEQISRDMMTLQAAEQNLSAKISSLTQPAAVRVAPRRNIAKLVHSEAPKPTAESLPLQPPAPETPSPADQPPRPPLPLSAPPSEVSSSAH
jgi:hypothetical protein